MFFRNVSKVQGLHIILNLEYLFLSRNKITSISTLAGLTKLKIVYLTNNQVTSISELQKMTEIERLELGENKISDITPLINNEGISGAINLKNNPLSNTALSTHIPALEARGITVEYDMPEGVVLFKDANLEKAISFLTSILTPPVQTL